VVRSPLSFLEHIHEQIGFEHLLEKLLIFQSHLSDLQTRQMLESLEHEQSLDGHMVGCEQAAELLAALELPQPLDLVEDVSGWLVLADQQHPLESHAH